MPSEFEGKAGMRGSGRGRALRTSLPLSPGKFGGPDPDKGGQGRHLGVFQEQM